jgi:cell division protein FtsL
MKKFVDVLITSLAVVFLILAVCTSLLSFVNQYEMYQIMNEHDEEPEIFNKTWECREQKDGDMICFKIKG